MHANPVNLFSRGSLKVFEDLRTCCVFCGIGILPSNIHRAARAVQKLSDGLFRHAADLDTFYIIGISLSLYTSIEFVSWQRASCHYLKNVPEKTLLLQTLTFYKLKLKICFQVCIILNKSQRGTFL